MCETSTRDIAGYIENKSMRIYKNRLIRKYIKDRHDKNVRFIFFWGGVFYDPF